MKACFVCSRYDWKVSSLILLKDCAAVHLIQEAEERKKSTYLHIEFFMDYYTFKNLTLDLGNLLLVLPIDKEKFDMEKRYNST